MKMKRKEFAVMRCLGMKRYKVFGIVFKEQLISVVIGAIPSAIIGCFFYGNIMTVLISVFTVSGVFLLGATISTIHVTSVNVMELMKKELLEGWCWQTTETSVIFLNDMIM